MKILFDECIGRPLTKAIAALLSFTVEKPEVKHLQDIYHQGIKDDVWIPRAAEEGWIIITADKAKKQGGRKLPSICNKFKVKHILISGNLHKSKHFEKARAVISAWPEIAEIPLKQTLRFSLHYTSNKNITLEERP